jgi:hypothetical protein
VGPHRFSATQTDGDGDTSQESNTVNFRVDATLPPPPAITGPAPGEVVPDPRPPITGTGEPGDTVDVTEGGRPLCTATVQPDGRWSCVPTRDLPDGPHTVTATQTDPEGNISDPVEVTFEVDTTPPEISLDPTDGTEITGTTEPGATVDVTLDDGTPIPGCQGLVADAQGKFQCRPTPAIPPGSNIRATATDPYGNGARATEKTTVPVAPVTLDPLPAVGMSQPPQLSGTGEPGYTVAVTDGANVLCQAVVAADGTWSCTSAIRLGGGEHAVVAPQTRPGGDASPAGEVGVATISCAPPPNRIAAVHDQVPSAATTAWHSTLAPSRSEARRVGKEGGASCRSRWSPDH